MESNVEFEAVDFPQANRLTIHIMAAIAEHEAKLISDRTRSALANLAKIPTSGALVLSVGGGDAVLGCPIRNKNDPTACASFCTSVRPALVVESYPQFFHRPNF